MKTKTIFTFIFLLSLSFLRFTNPVEQTNPLPPPEPNDPAGDFLIGVMESYGDMTNYDLAGGLNLSHAYIGTEQTMYEGRLRYTPYSWVTGSEHLQDGVPVTAINSVMQNLNNHNSRIFWQRPKIEWLCFGQSSIYKAYQENPDYWFYSYNDLAGQQYPDWQFNGGKNVLYCSVPNLGPGARTVLSRLKANTEQCRYDGANFNQWVQDHDCDWYVKPRIRIPQAFVIPSNYEIPICRIIVLKQNGTSIKKETILKTKYFLDQNGNYNGDYIEEYNFFNETDLKFQGDLVTNGAVYPWAYNARGTCPNGDPENVNHADIKVEWLGNCEMWIDYVKVENDVANRLLKGNDVVFEQWIQDEVNAVKDPFPGSTLPTPYNFYIELFEFNNIPCMAYVNKKIRQYSGNQIGLMADLLTQYNIHMPWGERGTLFTPEKLRRMFFDRTEFPQVFIGDPYPITADKSVYCGGTQQYNQIPETFNLPVTDNDLFVQTPPATYDAWLQGLLDTVCVAYEGGLDPPEHTSPIVGDFRFLMQNGNKVSRECDKPFIAMLQAHQWYSGGEIDREPTNEEQNLMVNEAVSYGAKGIVFWWFPSFGNINSCDYSYGFIKDGHPRDNLYGQDKWGNFQTIIQRLKSWGPTLMSFDNKQTRSYIYRLERNELLSETYFYDVASYILG